MQRRIPRFPFTLIRQADPLCTGRAPRTRSPDGIRGATQRLLLDSAALHPGYASMSAICCHLTTPCLLAQISPRFRETADSALRVTMQGRDDKVDPLSAVGDREVIGPRVI